MEIFISYSTANKDFVDKIDAFFHEKFNLRLVRDTRDLKYKGNVDEFMQRVRTADRVLVLVSKDFLQSKFCMYEMMELLKDLNHKEKILPILLGDIDVFDPSERLTFSLYWKQEFDKLNNLIKEFSSSGQLAEIADEVQNLKRIQHIRANVNDFLVFLASMRLVQLKEMEENNFQEIAEILDIKAQPSKKIKPIFVPQKLGNYEELRTELTQMLREDIEQVFARLNEIVTSRSDLASTLVLLEARYNSLKNKEKIGIVSDVNFDVALNRLRHSLLSVFEDLEEENLQFPISFSATASPTLSLEKLISSLEKLTNLIQKSESKNTSNGFQEASDILLEKISYLRKEKAKLAAGARKFEVSQQLLDTEKELQTLQNQFQNTPNHEITAILATIKQGLGELGVSS